MTTYYYHNDINLCMRGILYTIIIADYNTHHSKLLAVGFPECFGPACLPRITLSLEQLVAF